MEYIRLTTSEVFAYVALFHAAVGFALGLIPLILGFVKGKIRTGIIGLVVGTVGGALLGFLGSIPAMAIFTWLILRDQFVPTDIDQPPAASVDTKQD